MFVFLFVKFYLPTSVASEIKNVSASFLKIGNFIFNGAIYIETATSVTKAGEPLSIALTKNCYNVFSETIKVYQ